MCVCACVCVCVCVCSAVAGIRSDVCDSVAAGGAGYSKTIDTEDRRNRDGVDKTPVRVIRQVDGMGARGTTIPHW